MCETVRKESRAEELKSAKLFNKIAVVIIAAMLILLSFMAVNMRRLTEQYEQLEFNYEELYEEWNERNGIS